MKQITLTQGKIALVDDEDYERVAQFKWGAIWNGKKWYAVRKFGNKTVYMHTFVFGALLVDHRDGDGLNNQQQNLRKCTYSQNNMNARLRKDNKLSGFKGVTMNNGDPNQWVARIYIDKKKIHLGCFKTAVDAAKAYDAAAKQFYGEFARPNFGGVV